MVQVGWEKIRGDVFRQPEFGQILAVVTGIGAQVTLGTLVFLLEIVCFFSNQVMRPLTMTIGLVSLAASGVANGFMTARFLKFFKSGEWKDAACLSVVMFPSYMFILFVANDFVEIASGSSDAVPLARGIGWSLAWLALDVPLSTYGAYKGFTMRLNFEADVAAVKGSEPKKMPLYLRGYVACPIASLAIFMLVIVELNSLMDSFWGGMYLYALFGFLFIVFICLVCVTAMLSIVQTYWLLCNQNFNWWWRAYLTGALSGVWFFAYALYYLFVREDYSLLSSDIVYILHMLAASACFGSMCGAISLFASYKFVERIYTKTNRGSFVSM